MPIDILAGSDLLRKQIERGMPISEIGPSWESDELEFRRLREPYLIYS